MEKTDYIVQPDQPKAEIFAAYQKCLQVIDGLTATNQKNEHAISELSSFVAVMQQELALLRANMFGPKSEKTKSIEGQTLLDLKVAQFMPEILNQQQTEEITYTRKKRSKSLANTDNLEVVVEDVFPEGFPDASCERCGTTLELMSFDARRTIEHQPEKWYVRELRIWSTSCPECKMSPDGAVIVKAEAAPALIPGSQASPSALAAIISERFIMASPYYRIETKFRYDGVGLSRQTMCNWVIKCNELYFQYITSALKESLLKNTLLHADETPYKIFGPPGQSQSKSKSYIWLYRTGSDATYPIAYYDPQLSRKHECAFDFLEGWSGYLHADGYGAYQSLETKREKEGQPAVKAVGCWAHARRKFTDAIKGSKKKGYKPASGLQLTLAREGVAYISTLFKIDEEIAKVSDDPDYRKEQRDKLAVPVVAEFKEWLETNAIHVLPESGLGKAFKYTRNQWPYLVRYLEDGRLECSNNRALRIGFQNPQLCSLAA